MNAYDLFAAAVRVVGLLSGGRGLYDLIFSALDALNLTGRSVSADIRFQDFVFGVFYLLFGLYLLRGAPWIMNFSFPDLLDSSDRAWHLRDVEEDKVNLPPGDE